MRQYDGTPDPVGTALARPPYADPANAVGTGRDTLQPVSPLTVSYSTSIAETVTGSPQRGLVHSVFRAAANILFPNNFMLSLNTATSPRMPNGIQLPTLPGTPPLSHLRNGMPVLFGAKRLCIQPLDYVLDLSSATQWNPHIEQPPMLDLHTLQKNIARVARYVLKEHGQTQDFIPEDGRPSSSVADIARALCGRGPGLTPAGDDMLAGWMAMGWLLHGPQSDFLAQCQQIVTIARQQTHLLSQCWLEYAARGNVAEPVLNLLYALTQEDKQRLISATKATLSLGATSGYDLILGIVLATHPF